MVMNRKVKGTASSMPAGLALGGCVSMAVTLIGSLLAAQMVLRETISESGIGCCSMFILLLSSAMGALVSVKLIKHRKLYVCVLSGLIYYGMLLGMTALFFGGIYKGMGVTALVIAAGCGIVVLLGLNREKTPRKRKSKIGYR